MIGMEFFLFLFLSLLFLLLFFSPSFPSVNARLFYKITNGPKMGKALASILRVESQIKK